MLNLYHAEGSIIAYVFTISNCEKSAIVEFPCIMDVFQRRSKEHVVHYWYYNGAYYMPPVLVYGFNCV